MNMSGMDMSDISSTMSSMTSSVASMSMPTITSITSSMSTMSSMDGMDGMDMSGNSSMTMTMWMTTRWKDAPVFFKTLEAHSSGAAFGIFCVLFFSCFFFRGLIFLSSYLEQEVFHNFSNTIVVEEDCECGPEDSIDKKSVPDAFRKPNLTFGQVISKLFNIGLKDLYQDFIRLVLAFTIVMFGYAIMLAAMSFVVLYFFAICLGLAFGEIFFNRLAIILNVNKAFGACSGLH